ncbi:TPA: hypothetical protein N3A15_002186 [Salmonella enterica subsp. salamae serovar 51:c:-]|nr:hypothetical protein [Salmonella enterica subsp. salamae serovar 51:c:-]
MKERGMIFNGEMVRAILDGRKTQTRRVMKPQPDPCPAPRGGHWWPSNVFKTMLHVEEEMQNSKGGWGGLVGDACPFGDVGDRIWVRETFSCIGNEDGHPVDANSNLCSREDAQRIYRASAIQKPGNYGLWTSPDGFDFEGAWTPSIHMPRWASRITLEITDVRVERVQDISQRDAIAEGGPPDHPSFSKISREMGFSDWPRSWFAQTWWGIYGREAWNTNPWVWVIEFKRVEGGAA